MDNKILEIVRMSTSHEEIIACLKERSQFHGPTMMVRKFILDNLGEVYRPYFNNFHEDVDLSYRIAEKYLSYNIDEILYKYRVLDNSLCRKEFNIKNKNFYKVVVFLADQREKYGHDCLQKQKETRKGD